MKTLFFTYTIKGRIPSKKNTVLKGRYGQMYQAKQPELDAITWQLRQQKKHPTIISPVCVSYNVNSHSRRQDFSNIVASIDDCLEKAEIIKNDRQIEQTGLSFITFDKKTAEGAVVEISGIKIIEQTTKKVDAHR